MSKLNDLFPIIEKNIFFAEKSNSKISNRGVDWHLNHSLMIINSICENMAKSNPNEYQPKFSILKSFILLTGYIPRGKGRSPKPFNKKEKTSQEELHVLLTKAKAQFKSIEELPKNAHFQHPMFGHLNLKQANRFLYIHTNHHLKIIKDILK